MNYDIKVDEYGTKTYRINNLLHKDDGPAREYNDVEKQWWLNDKY